MSNNGISLPIINTQKIKSNSKDLINCVGIYIVREEDSCVYVGKSINLYSRIKRVFDLYKNPEIEIVKCEEQHLDKLEIDYIKMLIKQSLHKGVVNDGKNQAVGNDGV